MGEIQEKKSRETKQKIFQAAKDILQRDGYEKLSIKNICSLAGVSNGSFYHHFKTKDDLLSYYIEELPMDTAGRIRPENRKALIEAVVNIYRGYAAYCRNLGVGFIGSYYDTKNKALNPQIRTRRAYPIEMAAVCLQEAATYGLHLSESQAKEMLTDIRTIVIGSVFDWCLSHGEGDLEGSLERCIGRYMNEALPDDFQ